MNKMKLTAAEFSHIEKVTCRQADSPEWHSIRTGRITASVAHTVLHTNMETPAPSLMKRVCFPSKVSTSNVPSLIWGKTNEKTAISVFEKKHKNVVMQFPGLRLHKDFPYIGASPDGLYHCECHEEDLVMIEVKCPYSKRDTKNVEEACKDITFFLMRT